MTVHRGTMDVRQRNFSSETLTWEAASTGGVAGAASTQVSVSNFPAGALDATLQSIKTQTDKLTFDVLNALQITGLAIGASTTVNVSSLAGAVMVRSSAADHLGTVYQSSIADLKATVAQNSTVWAIQADGRVRAQNSTIGDLLASVQQNSSVWQVQPGSTVFAKSAGFSVDSSNAQNVKLDGSTALSVQQNSSVWQVQAGSTAFIKNAGVFVDSSNYIHVKIDGSTRINIGSTAADNAVRALNSSAADFQGLAVLRTSSNSVALDQSTNAAKGGLVGLVVRQGQIATTSISNTLAATSTNVAIMSSIAAQRVYCYAYEISVAGSTLALGVSTAILVQMQSGAGGTELWRFNVEAGVSGEDFAATVNPPQYLFASAPATALTLTKSSNGAIHYSFACWQE